MNRRFFCRFIIAAILACGIFGCSYTSINFNQETPIVKSADPDYPKAIVVYDTWSGNTRCVAETIAETLMCLAVHVDHISGCPIDELDLIIIGSPVHGGMPTEKIETFLSEFSKPSMSAVFVTFGAPLFGPFTANACMDKMEKKLHGTCLGRFKCHGFHKILRTYPEHPDEKDRSDAEQFAVELLDRCLLD